MTGDICCRFSLRWVFRRVGSEFGVGRRDLLNSFGLVCGARRQVPRAVASATTATDLVGGRSRACCDTFVKV